jgi:hypothetical protein
MSGDEVLALRADLDSWWNDMDLTSDEVSWSRRIVSGMEQGVLKTEHPQATRSADQAAEDPRRRFATLFTCLYQQQIINLSRPTLSLSPSKIEHAAALQSTIAAVRLICATLSNSLINSPSSLFWPGYVDMVFFGSLILVYGARREAMRGRSRPAPW